MHIEKTRCSAAVNARYGTARSAPSVSLSHPQRNALDGNTIGHRSNKRHLRIVRSCLHLHPGWAGANYGCAGKSRTVLRTRLSHLAPRPMRLRTGASVFIIRCAGQVTDRRQLFNTGRLAIALVASDYRPVMVNPDAISLVFSRLAASRDEFIAHVAH